MSSSDYTPSTDEDMSSDSVQALDPDQLVKGFSRTNFIRFMLISVVLHVIVIGGTSMGYVFGLVNPPDESTAETTSPDGVDGVQSEENTDNVNVAEENSAESSVNEAHADQAAISEDATPDPDSVVDPEQERRDRVLEKYNERADPVSDPTELLDLDSIK